MRPAGHRFSACTASRKEMFSMTCPVRANGSPAGDCGIPQAARLNGRFGAGALCGLRAEPARLRMRVLCPRLRTRVRGLCDIEAPIADLAALQLAPTISLVVENLNTGIALPDIDGTVGLHGFGPRGRSTGSHRLAVWRPAASVLG